MLVGQTVQTHSLGKQSSESELFLDTSVLNIKHGVMSSCLPHTDLDASSEWLVGAKSMVMEG